MENISKEDKAKAEKARGKIKDAVAKASKMTASDVKEFMDRNRGKIDKLAQKLEGAAKKDFERLVRGISDCCAVKAVAESEDMLSKTLCGAVAFILWMLDQSGILVTIALSPIIGPALNAIVKKAFK
jgi:hypothetical protein